MSYGPADFATPFEPAQRFGAGLVARLMELGWPNEAILNINFPARPAKEIGAVEVTRQGFRDVMTRYAERRTDLRGRDYYWLGYRAEVQAPAEGTDLRAADEGRISVTPLHIDLTHAATLAALAPTVNGPPPALKAVA
jgi:5'-nucleotidase